MTKETVSFEFPKGLVRRAKIDESLSWDEIVKDPVYNPIDRLESLLYLQILRWQKAERLKVTPNAPPGTEVEITDPGYQPEPLYRSWLVGPNPRGEGAVVDDELRGYLLVDWEYLRLVEPLAKEHNE